MTSGVCKALNERVAPIDRNLAGLLPFFKLDCGCNLRGLQFYLDQLFAVAHGPVAGADEIWLGLRELDKITGGRFNLGIFKSLKHAVTSIS